MTDRMRKVNESLREVLSEAVLELKDPRIGFVTVTGVRDVSGPPPRDGVRQRARLRAQARALARGARRRRTACCRPASAREVRLKRTPTLTFEYDPTVEEGVRMSKLIDELAPDR